jgi:hypothetical protein
MNVRIASALLAGLVATAACVSSEEAVGEADQASSARSVPADEDAIRPTAQERLDMLARATTFAPLEADIRRERPILLGPELYKLKRGALDRRSALEFEFNRVVECDYIDPWTRPEPGGKTPKYNCAYTHTKANGETKTYRLKVKYDEPSSGLNSGLYGEVLATRLLWALGFPADTMLPVQVRCRGCPREPWSHSSGYFALLDAEAHADVLAGPRRERADQEIADDSVRYVGDTLSRYAAFAGVRSERVGIGRRLLDGSGRVILSTDDGFLRVGAEPLKVYDPTKRRLVRGPFGGIEDYVVNHLDPAVLGGPERAVREHVSAVVEVKHLSIPIETFYHEGWSFNRSPRDPERQAEIRIVDGANSELVEQRQELALLAAFIAHADNKAEQQRFICVDKDKIEAEDDDCDAPADPRSRDCRPGTDRRFTSCDKPMLMLQDLGFTMGFGAKVVGTGPDGRLLFDGSPQARAYGTADAQGFGDAPLFKDQASCTTTVNEWATGVEIEERISEKARASLSAKLERLANDEGDLTGLFRAARLHLKALHVRGEPFPAFGHQAAPADLLGGELEAQLIEGFKSAFRARVAKLASLRCPEP